jgi:hypothetical protein
MQDLIIKPKHIVIYTLGFAAILLIFIGLAADHIFEKREENFIQRHTLDIAKICQNQINYFIQSQIENSKK